MARIPENELERLKREVRVERLAEARGVALTRHGADLRGLCPFHEDREPSLVITPAKNLWHCLGACQTGGSVVDWVMRAEGVSFRHAVELLRGELASPRPETPGAARPAEAGQPEPQSTGAKRPDLLEADPDDQVLLRQVVDYYHATLLQSPEALGYLAGRGLRHPEMVGHFRLGFANRTLTYRLPSRSSRAGMRIRERLQGLGVLRADSGHEHLNGSVVVPVFDEAGRVAELYGRKITPGLRAGTPRHLYLPGPHRGVWNVEALAASPEIILCESLLDALTFWCAGFRHVTAAYGTAGVTPDHWRAFARYGTERLLIAYDRDEAGEAAAEALAAELADRGIGAYRIQIPRGMDANSYAQKLHPASHSLELLIGKAVWLGKGPAPGLSTRAALLKDEAGEEGIAAATVGEPPAPAPEEAPFAPSDADGGAVAGPPPARAAEAPSEVSGPAPEEPLPPLAAPPKQAEAAPSVSSSEPPAPVEPPTVELRGDEVVMRMGDRRWRVRGLAKNKSHEVLRVNVLVARGEAFHVDTFDLYAAKSRRQFVAQAAEELEVEERVVKAEFGQVFRRLEALQEEAIRQALEPKTKPVELSDTEREEALELLRDPDLLNRILRDFDRCGVVGEETNKLTCYLAAISRKLKDPLAVAIQSSSAAGKSSLMEAVLDFVPEEERVQYSAMTGQSLFYMGKVDLRNKILAVAEGEGADQASYPLKLLQSEGKLTIASTGKDPHSGRLETQEYRVEGPVMIFLTTTAIEVDEELLNRCLVLTVDEERAQTRAIHRLQNESQTLEGLLAREDRQRILKLHRNAQRLLRPVEVVNPYAPQLTFPNHQTRMRRDFMKYHTILKSVAFLLQHQREILSREHRGQTLYYIEVDLADIAVTNRLVREVLGRSLDELPGPTRRLLGLLDQMVAERARAQGLKRCDVRFTRREAREWTGWGHSQIAEHLNRLVELEYVVVHGGGPGRRFLYELVWEGDVTSDRPDFPGLIDVEELAKEKGEARRKPKDAYDGRKPQPSGRVTGGFREGSGQVPNAGESAKSKRDKGFSENSTTAQKSTVPGRKKEPTSYVAGASYAPGGKAPKKEDGEQGE